MNAGTITLFQMCKNYRSIIILNWGHKCTHILSKIDESLQWMIIMKEENQYKKEWSCIGNAFTISLCKYLDDVINKHYNLLEEMPLPKHSVNELKEFRVV